MKKLLIPAAILFASAIAPLHAEVLAIFTMQGSLRTSADSDGNSLASPISDGLGFGASIDTTRGNPTPSLAVDSTQIDGSTNTAAVGANDYFTFTLTPISGASFSLTSLTFDYANYTNDGTFPAESFFARSSRDGFGSNLAATVSAAAASAGVFATSTIALTAGAFQNQTTAIEFRIYLQDGTTDLDRGALLDNITLNGVTVPEPSAALMLLASASLFALRRFRAPEGR